MRASAILALAALALPSSAHANAKACLDAAESGQALRADGQLLEAKQAFIVCAATSCPASVRVDCARWLTETDHALPSIIVRVHDETDHDLQNATLTMDGRPAALDGRPVVVNPGKHVLRVEAPRRDAVEEPIVVRQSERDRIVSVALAPTPAARPRSVVHVDSSVPIPVASWVLWGIGAAAIGTGVVVDLVGSAEHGDLERSCARTSSCAHDDVTSARTKLIVGDMLVGAGVIAVGVGLYVAFTRGTRSVARSTLPVFRF